MTNGAPSKRTSADFIVMAFVVVVSIILIGITITAMVLAIWTDKDVNVFTTAIIDLTGTVIAALVGYLAGKSGSSEPVQ